MRRSRSPSLDSRCICCLDELPRQLLEIPRNQGNGSRKSYAHGIAVHRRGSEPEKGSGRPAEHLRKEGRRPTSLQPCQFSRRSFVRLTPHASASIRISSEAKYEMEQIAQRLSGPHFKEPVYGPLALGNLRGFPY